MQLAKNIETLDLNCKLNGRNLQRKTHKPQ